MIQKNVKFLLTLVVFCLLFPVYSRGLWEFALQSKITAYLIQFTAAVGSVTAVLISNRNKFRFSLKSPYPWALFAFFLAQIVSLVITVLKTSFWQEALLFCLIIDFLLLFIVTSNYCETDGEDVAKTVIRVLFVCGVVNLAAAILEEYIGMQWITLRCLHENKWLAPIFNFGGFFYHNNIAIIRATGLTGSYLHLPLIMPLLGALVIRYDKSRVIRAVSSIFILVPFVLMSRSGMIISAFILAGLAIYGIKLVYAYAKANPEKRPWILAVSGVLVAGLLASFLLVPAFNKYLFMIWTRITTIDDMANSSRFQIWFDHLKAYAGTNLFFGEYTGFSTNTALNLLGFSRFLTVNPLIKGVSESSPLSLLLSFGLIGLISYYSLLVIQIIRVFKKREFFLGLTLTGAVVQTFFFQSIEVMPFMFSLALIPFFVNSRTGALKVPNNGTQPNRKETYGS